MPMKVQPFRSAALNYRQTGPFFDSRKVIKKRLESLQETTQEEPKIKKTAQMAVFL